MAIDPRETYVLLAADGSAALFVTLGAGTEHRGVDARDA
jgi:hypothetical protein